MAMDGEENILVVGRSNHRIQKFTANGQFLTAVDTCGLHGTLTIIKFVADTIKF